MAMKLQKAYASLGRAPGDELRLAVVADTHSAPHPRTVPLLRELAPHAILHAGDIGDLSVLAPLAEVAPLHVVRGNIDGHQYPDELVLDIVGRPEAATVAVPPQLPGELRVLLLHIGVNGPRLRAEAARAAAAHRASLVICGHSHVPFIGRDRGIAVFNPGSAGPRRFALPIVFGTITISGEKVKLAHIDCETGQAWSPPCW
jgi:uncharacterized protein